MAVYQLDEELWFPLPYDGENDGLIAVGGDLSVNRLILAYTYGIFPWYAYKVYDEPLWYCPLQRFVIFPQEIHISHSLRTLMNRRRYEITMDCDFDGVIRNCSTTDKRNSHYGSWLGPHIIEAYTELHRRGLARSVEVWDSSGDDGERKLVGGLYGVYLNGGFFGESMFSLAPNTSKLALVHLAQWLEVEGGKFIDCQFETPHLKSMGGRHIHWEDYIDLLAVKLDRSVIGWGI